MKLYKILQTKMVHLAEETIRVQSNYF